MKNIHGILELLFSLMCLKQSNRTGYYDKIFLSKLINFNQYYINLIFYNIHGIMQVLLFRHNQSYFISCALSGNLPNNEEEFLWLLIEQN